MGYEKTVGADVTTETYDGLQDLAERRGVNSSEVVRAAVTEHLARYERQSLGRSFLKWAALGLAIMALVAFAYGTAIGYPRPAVLGAWIMVPSLISLALYDEYNAIARKIGFRSATASEA